jgi:uncharacterized protein (DUF983 family)
VIFLAPFLFGSHEFILTTIVLLDINHRIIMNFKMEVLMMKDEIQICCVKCGRRLFDYFSGELAISVKCNRCGRVIKFKKCTEKYFRDRSVHGQMYI